MATNSGAMFSRDRTPSRRARSSPPRTADPAARSAIANAEARLGTIEAQCQGFGQQLLNLEANLRQVLEGTNGRVGTMENSLKTFMATVDAKVQEMLQQLQNTTNQAAAAAASAAAAQQQPPVQQHTPQQSMQTPPGMPASFPAPNQNHTGSPDMQHFSSYSNVHRKTIMSPKSDFADLPQFDGGHKSDPDLWYKKVRNHLIAQHRDLKQFLDWVESKGSGRITMGEVRSYSGMTDLDPLTISGELWGFLNVNLCGEAHNGFLGIEETNGADAWRKVVHSIHGKTPVRRLALKRDVDSPDEAKDMSEVMSKIERWEEKVRKYIRAGGRELDDEEKCAMLLRIVPTNEQVSLIRKDFIDYEEMREYIRAQSELLQHLGLHRRPGALHPCHDHPHAAAHLIPHPSSSDTAHSGMHSHVKDFHDHDCDYSQFSREELMAVVKGKGKGKSGAGGKNPGIICYSCGQQGHPQRLCPHAAGKGGNVNMGKGFKGGYGYPNNGGNKAEGIKGAGRINPNVVCYSCGQKGHPARLCPSLGKGGKGGVHAMIDGSEGSGGVQPEITLNVATSEPSDQTWQPAKNPVKKHIPTRTPFTIADYLKVNRFDTGEAEEDGGESYALYDNTAHQPELHQAVHSRPSGSSSGPKKKKSTFRPMLDSGAGEFVCASRHAPGIAVRPSPGSLRGQTFGTAGKDVLHNLGEQRFVMKTQEGQQLGCTWQTAEVSRPLMGVGRVCDTDDRSAFFDKNCARVLDRNTTEAVRQLIRERGNTLCRFEREGGVYVMEAEIEGNEDSQDFTRQGR